MKLKINKRLIKKILLWGGIFLILFIVLVYTVYRHWALTWGATDAEINRPMPGDKYLKNPCFNATRAVTIKAQPEDIWPWLLQIGYKRAGFYSYDRLDNDGIPSAKTILPEYQNLKVGDRIPVSKNSFVKVAVLEPFMHMLLVFESKGSWANATWAWGLYRQDSEYTRLVTRLRTNPNSFFAKTALDLFEIIMMRKCMLGIKARTEKLSEER